jgi:single-strand DNA-binding protein
MAGSVNKVILIGNLGKDPEIRVLDSGAKLARFPIATSESYQDKQSGERREITEWHNIVVWRGLADVAENYLKKGSKVYIEGKIRSRSWQDETGNTKYSTEIIGDNFTMLGSKQEMQSGNNAPYPTQQPSKPSATMDNDLTSNADDDDLPF